MAKFPDFVQRAALSLFILVTLSATVFGQEPQQQPITPTVKSIEVRYSGPPTVARERILAQMRTRVGDQYSSPIVEQDIRNLYSTGQVVNVRIFAEPEGNGVKVIVAVQTRSVIREIEIEGADRISAKRIRKKVAIKINSMVDEEKLEKSRQDLIDMYRSRGFNDVDIRYRIDTIDASKGASRLVYTISEGAKGAVSSIQFEGNHAFSDRVLRKQMKTRGKTMLAMFDKSGRLDENQLKQDIDAVRDWYQNHGYIDAQVKEASRERRKNGPMIITIAVDEGTEYHVGRLSISGFKMTTEQRIRAILKMKEGDVYSPKQLHDDAKKIADAYGSGGYVDLEIAPSGTPAGPGLINVSYKIEEGSRSFVERINIIGNIRTKDKVLRREVLVAPGDVYNTVRVEASKKRLENLGYFSKVEAFPEDTGIAGRKDLTIQVEEKRTGSLSFGGGFSTVDNLVAFAELSQGNFDIMNWPGFTGAGQKFRIRVQVGTQRQDYLISLTEPWFLDRRLSLGGSIFYSEADYLSSVYNQRNYGLSLELRKPLNAFMYATLGYRLEELEIYDIASSNPDLLALAGSRLRSEVLASIVFDRRDNPMLSHTGQRVTISPYVAGGPLGGDDQIYGWDLEASQYFHLPYDTILLFNGEAAVVDSWGDGSTVNLFDRLYLGGSNNLRGFAYRDVGPRDSTGEPLGGRSMARGTIEFTAPVIPDKARVAIFYDTGFLNSDSYDFSTHDTASDWGFGVRLNLPVGPMRIDYGIPIQKNGRSGGGHFNFNVGYQF